MKHIPEFLVVFSHTVACVGVGQKQCEAGADKTIQPIQDSSAKHHKPSQQHGAGRSSSGTHGYKQRWWLQTQLVVTNTAGGYKHSWWL